MKAGLEQLPVPDADGLAEAQFDGDLIRFDRKNAGQNESRHQRHHQQFDDVEAAAQRFGQRASAGIFDAVGRVRGCRRLRPGRFARALVFGM